MTGTAGPPAGTPASGSLRAWHLAVSFGLACLGFFLPFSSAGVSLSLAGLVVLTLLRPRLLWQLAPWKEPVMAVGLALFGFMILHVLWRTGWHGSSFGAVNHYHELLFAPMLLALLHDERHRLVFIRSLMAGAAFLALAHWLPLLGPSLSPLLAARRISAGFALAVCAFILVMRARGRPAPWPRRWLAAFLAATVLYAIEGRTGHVVLLVLAACAAWMYSPPRWRWAAAGGCSLLVLLLAMSSGAVTSRMGETLAGAKPDSDVAITSTMIRIKLLRVAGDLAREHAILGNGYAEYGPAHRKAALLRYGPEAAANPAKAAWMQNSNPHNEYLMQLISGGIVGAGLFVAWLALGFREAARARRGVSGMMGGVVLAFAIGCLFNSLLLDFIEGHLYMALLAWLVAEARHAPEHDRRTAEMESVLVIATRQIGDVLLTTPLVHAARQRWPGATIDVLGFEGTLGMLRGNPDINRLIEVPPRQGFGDTVGLIRRLWRRYDMALVTDPGDRAHLLGWFAAPYRSGVIPAEGRSKWLKALVLDHAVVAAGDRGDVHVTAEKQALLGPWLAMEPDVAVVVPPPAAPLPEAVDAALQPGAVVIHAPSMWPYKQWPIAHFEQLVKAMLAEGRQVVLTGSAGTRDQECVAPLRALAAPPQLLDFSGQLDFNQLVSLFQRAALYIGPDTSVSHLAASTGVPVIAIFGPTNPMRWAPWPSKPEASALFERSVLVQRAGNVTLLQSGLHCVPCGKAGCEDHRQSRSDCLVDITPGRVIEEARKILAA